MIKAIIFDFGGVCFYPGTSSQLLLEAIFKSKLPKLKVISVFLKSRKEIKRLVDMFNEGLIDEKTLFKKIKKIAKYEFDEKELKNQIIEIHKPIKPVIELIKKLRKKYKLCLLTNNNVWLDELNKKHNFYGYFDVVVNSYKFKVSKPSRRIYEIALEKLKVKPEECVFIDDKKENVEAAANLRMKSIRYKNPNQLLKELRKMGVFYD